jgi:putative transposase
MALLDSVRKAIEEGDGDFLRETVHLLAQGVMEAEVTELTGVPKGERAPERRLTQRNGYRDRRWDTRVGTIDLAIPRVRDGNYFPSLLEPRRRAERALLAVVQEAYVLGVSTRRVDDLVQSLGITGISKSEVSRICAALDAEVETFRNRPLLEAYPYVWFDATYLKVREAGRVVSMAALVATGVAMTGERRVLGIELASGNDEGSAWPSFLRSLVGRGLHGVRLVISDDHAGLVKAIREQLLGSGWQRCRVHLTRNAQDLVPRSARSMIASAVRSIFEQPDEHAAREQFGGVIDSLEPRFPAVARLLLDAEPDLLAHFTFPETHRRQIRSTNPLERLNKEIKRRTAVVGIFPNRASVIRLVGMILAEQDDEWQDGRRYFRPETMAAIDAVIEHREVEPGLLMAS